MAATQQHTPQQPEGQGTVTEEDEKDEQVREQSVEVTEGLHPDNHWLLEDDLLENVLKCRPIDKMAWLEDIKSARQKEEMRCRTNMGQDEPQRG